MKKIRLTESDIIKIVEDTIDNLLKKQQNDESWKRFEDDLSNDYEGYDMDKDMNYENDSADLFANDYSRNEFNQEYGPFNPFDDWEKAENERNKEI